MNLLASLPAFPAYAAIVIVLGLNLVGLANATALTVPGPDAGGWPHGLRSDEITHTLNLMLFGADHGYTDLVPAMQKIVQAAGRVLRTPEDRGWLWLLDDRFRRDDVVALLPPWWLIR